MTALVVRTFAFVDLCGFTRHIEDRGLDAAARTLAHFRLVIRRAAELHGVRMVKWLGDGSMLVAVTSDDLLACLDDVWGRPPGRELPLRGGVATGEVMLLEGDDYIGRPVNLAARLCGAARPGQLLVAHDKDDSASFVLRLRGMSGPIGAVDRRAPAPPRRAA